MRELLFKAKRTYDGKWVEGFYCNMSETTYALAEDYDKEPVPVHHYITQETMTDWGLPNRMYLTEVDPETVCQYTGLTDKNGNRVWENDIVKTNSGRICKVIWFSSPQHQGWDLIPLEGKSPAPSKYNLWSELAVVGNVFDNPGLPGGDRNDPN